MPSLPGKKTAPAGGKRHKRVAEEDEVAPIDERNALDVELDASLSRDEEEGVESQPGALRYKDIYIPPPPPSTCSFQNTGPRLIMKSLVVNNFKSFFGKHTIGPFYKGMSAVIGPNGSGKSNVLDSILFVFGYRASKIRTKKVAMLIHNSTDHTDLPSCSVTVNFVQVFDKGPSQDAEEVPDSEVVVSRTANRDSSSYYTMDGKRVQYKEVAARLRSYGIDLANGRFLILQGEVEQIAQMKPKAENENDVGLLEFLEDIIGTLRYREPLAKAAVIYSQLDEAQEAQSEKVNSAEKHLKTLEEDKNQAVEFLDKENLFSRAQHHLLQKQAFDFETVMNVHIEEKNNFMIQMDELKGQIKEIIGKNKENEKRQKEKREEVDKKNQAIEKMDKKYKQIEKKDMELQENAKSHNIRRKKLKDSLKTEEKKLDDLKGLPQKNTKEIAELETLITRHEKDKTAASEALLAATEKLKADSEEPTLKLEGLEAELAILAKEREEKASVHQSNVIRLELCTKEENRQKQKLEDLTASLSKSKSDLNEKVKRLEELENGDLPKTRKELAEAREQLEIQRGERAKVDQRAAKLRAEIEGAKSAAESVKHRNRVVGALMQQCANGNIPGVFGRLGDLGAIDMKYDCAISSACGALDNILVDTVNTGEKCINYLRDTNTGRANFIVLEKVNFWGEKAKQKFSAPENVPRLFDLVQVEDERVLPAFYFALRDTLVADNIDQATRIGLGGRTRHRVVDLAGNVIETFGTMTGGGTPLRGRMGQKVTAGLQESSAAASVNTPQLRQSLEQLDSRSAKLMESIIALEQKERDLRTRLPQIENEVKRLRMDVQHLRQNIPELEKQMKNQKDVVSKTSSDQKEVQRLQKEVDDSTKELEAANSAAGNLESQVAQLNKQLNEIKHKHMGTLESKVKELTKKINKAQTDKNKLAAAILSVERNIQKSEEKIADSQQEITTLETELKEMVEELKSLGEKAKIALAEREAAGEEVLALEEEVKKIKDSGSEYHAEELELRNKKIEMDKQLVGIEDKINEKKSKMNEHLRELKSLKLEEIPGKEGPLEPFKMFSTDDLKDAVVIDLLYAVNKLKEARLKRPNLAIIEEYRTKELQYLEMVTVLEQATARREEAKNFISEARKQRFEEFTLGFQTVNLKLKEVFRMISMGGDAELELQDTFNPFHDGIVFSVRPRNKAWTQIDRLSGGEKTLSSLALIFGLHYYKPSPFYMMDEIDAALDARNVSIIGHYIKQFTTNCQFIVISLRPEMYDLFERRVVGVYKPDGCSRCLALDPLKFGDVLEEEATDDLDVTATADVSINTVVNSPQRKTPRLEASESQSPKSRPTRRARPQALNESASSERGGISQVAYDSDSSPLRKQGRVTDSDEAEK